MSALVPAYRVAGRRILKSAAYKAQKHARRAVVDLPTVSSSAWSRKITTTSATYNSHGLQASLVKGVVTPDNTDTLTDAPSRPLSLSTQQTAARLANTLELLEDEIGGDPEWSRRIESTLKELKSGSGRNGRLAVYGSPESGFRTVVTTLLADPLTQSHGARKAILDRANEEIGETFVTSYGDSVERDVNGLVVESPWLKDAAMDVHEVITRDTTLALSTLLESDVVLLVLDPVRLLDAPEIAAILPDLLGKPDVYFIVNGEIESNGLRDVGTSLDQEQARRVIRKLLEDQLRSSRSAFGLATKAAREKIVFLSTHKALRSMDALRSTLTAGETTTANASEHAFAKFKEEYLESNLGAVSAGLLGDIRAVRERVDRSGGLWEDTHAWLAQSASRYIARNLADVLDETREIEALCAQHADLLSQKRRELRRDTFTSGEAIKEEMDRAKRGVEEVLRKRLVWWKVMSWRVDMVAEEVGREVEERWAVELTQKLAFEAGRLQAIQKDLNARIFDVLSTFSPDTPAQRAPNTAHPYHSALFLNRLQRLAFENDITPTSLLNPVLARRNQLLRYSVPMLQARAHKMTWTTISLSFLFSLAAWTTAVPLELITHSTGLAAGLLGSLASIRWGVGLWAKAQRKFWQDWSRVEEGLEEDLGGHLERLLGQVEGVGLAGLKGVREMVVRRQKRADKVDVALRQLERTDDRDVRNDEVVERATA